MVRMIDLLEVWAETVKLWKTASRIWLAITVTNVILIIHFVFSHILVGA